MLESVLASVRSYVEALPYILPAVLIAIIFHESAHGWMSHLLGDPTPKLAGRLSLNPLKHLDPMGTLCLLLFRMGCAKPVPVDPRHYRNPRMGLILVALAGPGVNLVLALFFYLLRGLIFLYAPYTEVTLYLFDLTAYCAAVNVGLAMFNLVPIPPLDGSKVLGNLVPQVGGLYRKFREWWRPVLLVLLVSGILSEVLYTLNSTVNDLIWRLSCLLLGIG